MVFWKFCIGPNHLFLINGDSAETMPGIPAKSRIVLTTAEKSQL
jgi:hypothetical protein